jgi:hypothetical protein
LLIVEDIWATKLSLVGINRRLEGITLFKKTSQSKKDHLRLFWWMRLIPNLSLVQQSSILASGTYAGRTAVVSLQGRCCQSGTMSTSNVTTGEGMACSDCGELYGTYSSVNQYWFDSISPSSSSSFSVSKGPNQRVLTIDSLLSNSTARVPEEMSRFCT